MHKHEPTVPTSASKEPLSPFVSQSNLVDNEDDGRDDQASRFLVPNGSPDEAHGRTVVHGVLHDIEREAGHPFLHQNSKVIAEVGACRVHDPQGVSACPDSAKQKDDLPVMPRA